MARRVAISLLALVASALVATASAPSAVAPRSRVAIGALERAVLVQVNTLRRRHGLAPLRVSKALSAAAERHSREMARLGYFSHTSADGTSFATRVGRFYPQRGHRYWSVGENLLWSSPDVDGPGALRIWLESAPHRKNLLTARWREVGLSAVHVAAGPGTFGGQPVTIVTADFGVRR